MEDESLNQELKSYLDQQLAEMEKQDKALKRQGQFILILGGGLIVVLLVQLVFKLFI